MKKVLINYDVDNSYGSQFRFELNETINDIVLMQSFGSIMGDFVEPIQCKLLFLSTLKKMGLYLYDF